MQRYGAGEAQFKKGIYHRDTEITEKRPWAASLFNVISIRVRRVFFSVISVSLW